MGKWVKRILILIVVLVAAGYFGIPYLLGTTWAREKVRSAIAEKTGREVELGSISFGWFSGLTVSDVTVKQKAGDASDDGPLFKLGELALHVGLGDILDKTIHVDEFTVSEPRIVIIRDANGRFNFADLMEPAGGAPAPTPSPEPGGGPAPAPDGGGDGGTGANTRILARMDIENGTILYIDVPLGTRVTAEGIDAKGTWNDGKLDLDMTMKLNGGDVKLLASSNLTTSPSPFTVKEFTIDGATFDSSLAGLGLFLPLAGDSPEKASGTLSFKLADVSGKGFTMPELERTLEAGGSLSLSGGTLVSGPVTQIYSGIRGGVGRVLEQLKQGNLGALQEADDTRELSFDALKSTFSVQDGKIVTSDMSLSGGAIGLTLSGWTSLGGQIRYDVTAKGITDLFKGNEQVAKLLGPDATLPLTLTGSLGSPSVSADVAGLVKSAASRAAENAVRDAGEKAIEESGVKDRIKDAIPGGKLPGGLLPGGK